MIYLKIRGTQTKFMYKFTNRAGSLRAFENRNDYFRALENQLRVEHLQDLNRDLVYEEMQYGTIGDIVAETGIVTELELSKEIK